MMDKEIKEIIEAYAELKPFDRRIVDITVQIYKNKNEGLYREEDLGIVSALYLSICNNLLMLSNLAKKQETDINVIRQNCITDLARAIGEISKAESVIQAE